MPEIDDAIEAVEAELGVEVVDVRTMRFQRRVAGVGRNGLVVETTQRRAKAERKKAVMMQIERDEGGSGGFLRHAFLFVDVAPKGQQRRRNVPRT